ncbi:unnamed protein product, partial [Symbiodinium pilosum]
LGVSWSDATPQAKKQRVNRDVAADVVGALLKETAEFRVFQLTITRAEGFQTVLRQRLVVANAGAAVQPSYRAQSLRPLNDSLFPGSCEQGDMLLKATKHRLTVCLAETGHSAGGTSQAQAVSTQAVSTSQAPMKWTFYVPVSQGLYDLLQISESFEKKMTAFFDVGNHAYMKTVASKFTTSKYGKAAAGSQNDSAGTSAETVLLFSEVLPAALIGLAARDHLRSQAGSVSEAGSDASFSKTTLVSFKIPVALGAQVMNPVSSLSWLSVWETAWSQAPSNTSNEYEETLRQCELKVVEAKITTTPGANEDLSA